MKGRWRSRFDALKQRLVLTREEKRVIIFIVIALGLGLAAKHYRDTHPPAPDKIDKKHAHTRTERILISPTPPRNDARKHSPKKSEEAPRADDDATDER